MAYNDDGKREQVFWHIAPKQADHVAELIHKAISYYLQGDLGQWFWTITALREIVNYDLNEKERKILDDIEKDTTQYLRYWDIHNRYKSEGLPAPKQVSKGKSEFLLRVRKYQRKIFDCLKMLGYFPDKEDRTKLSF